MKFSLLLDKDCREAAQLHRKAFEKGWTENTFKHFLRDPLIVGLTLRQDTELQGFILWREIIDEAEIITYVIDPAHQRKGKGGLLMEHFFEFLKDREITRIFLEVAEDNEAGISLYRKYGFVFLSKRSQYYPRTVNRFVSALNFFKNLV